jgi:signal transduction histidine kinase
MEPKLIITNIGFILSAVTCLSLGIFVLYKDYKKSANIIFFLLTLSILGFQIPHIIGINTADSILSQKVFMYTMINLVTACLTVHWMLTFINKVKEKKHIIILFYTSAALLATYYLLFPYSFVKESVPKLYLPNYYNPGEFYWVMVVFFVVAGLYAFTYPLTLYSRADRIMKNRLKYFALSILFGYVLGSFAFFLVFDVSVDPMWSMLLGFYTIPLAYGILKYDLMNIRVIAKTAFVYAVGVVAVSLVIIVINTLNTLVRQNSPQFPDWVVPFLSGCIAVAFGAFVWNKIREADTLKYEFITVVTHKFRTPLTYIKWAAESIRDVTSEDDKKHAVDTILNANVKLVDLTNVLMGLARSENNQYLYHYAPLDLAALVRDVWSKQEEHAKEKNVTVAMNFESNIPAVNVDEDRIRSVLQILIENAIMYTPPNGVIEMTLKMDATDVLFSIKDSGIGIQKDEVPYVFAKFFRGSKAKLVDTEGMGVGLYMARDIINRHDGQMGVNSDGEGKGATFWFKLKGLN